MYNSVNLIPEEWCFQRYLWVDGIEMDGPIREKVIKTLIYGVKSSGNQAERGLRETARMSSKQYPKVASVVQNDTYVDDCMSGEKTLELAKSTADELELVLNKGGFTLKGVSFSGEDPPKHLTNDEVSISVGGMRWFTKTDELSLDLGDLCFAKKIRGRKHVDDESRKIPTKLTRRHCVSKVSEVYDLTGKITPIVSAMKLDLHELVKRKLDWDDCVPNDLKQIWFQNFDTLQELNSIRWKRAVVPIDAVDLKIETLDFGDASKNMSCSAIYARFKRKDGSFSCQLVLGRSKIVPEGTSQPRAELIAALLNTHSGKIVQRAFGDHHDKHLKFSDSQIVLFWIKNSDKPLNQWVRNRVIDIRRFTDAQDWYYVDSSNMIADLGTRRNALSIDDVGPNSTWINGFHWMTLHVDDMPIKSMSRLQLTNEQIFEAKREIPPLLTSSIHIARLVNKDEIMKRSEYSQYILDPNKYNFEKVIRIVGFVIKFIKLIRKRNKISIHSNHSVDLLSEDEIEESKMYYFRKATAEVKEFYKITFYEKFSTERNGVLWYHGRILPTDDMTIAGRYTNAMLDLAESTFCVPIIDKYSPIAYSIISNVHWNDKDVKHKGVETVWRQILKCAYVIEGRNIVKLFRKNCERCRYLNKRRIEITMGPISPTNTMIAPAFYATQVDLAGPFAAYSPIHKRCSAVLQHLQLI